MMTDTDLYAAPLTGQELGVYHVLNERGFPYCRADNPPPVYGVARVRRVILPLVAKSRRCVAPGCAEWW